MPEEGRNNLSFKNHKRKMKIPFVVYADFEAVLKKIIQSEIEKEGSYTQQYQEHIPYGFSYKIVFDEEIKQAIPKRILEQFSNPILYRAKDETEDISQLFVDKLEEDIRKIQQFFRYPREMIITREINREFIRAKSCWICNKPFNKDDIPVRDHCHFTGKYRGAAHQSCNLNFKKPKFTPVFFHNLSGYDSHLFVKNLGKSEGDISCIPNNEEKYISFTKQIIYETYRKKKQDGTEEEKNLYHDLRFVDSAKFMMSPLATLVKNLGKDKLHHVKKVYKDKTDLLTRKGVYPYDWADSFSKFKNTELPPKKDFFSRLNKTEITDDDYSHAQNISKEFNIKDFGEYHDLYLKSDVLFLADVFEEFRKVCQKHYNLDPAWYYTAPGLAWDAALKKSGIEFELLTDYDTLLMFENGIRGGVSMISKRYGKANNPYMKEDFNPKEQTKYLAYLDANNLYGWAMCKPLPVGSFRWMKEFKNWRNIPCILEVDLEYPEHLHDGHNDYPLAPEKIIINKVEKLIPTLRNKSKYVVHHEILKLYLQLGLKITKFHRGISFQEES